MNGKEGASGGANLDDEYLSFVAEIGGEAEPAEDGDAKERSRIPEAEPRSKTIHMTCV